MTIAVMHYRLMKGCSSLKTDADIARFSENCLDIMPLDTMLYTQFRYDAHFVCYTIPGDGRHPRLNKSVLSDIRENGMDIVMNYFSFDYDNAGHSDWNDAAAEEFAKSFQDASKHPALSAWHTVYTTKHGARILFKLSRSVPVDVAEGHLLWMLEQYAGYGFRVGVNMPDAHIDASCRDWTRCFRCPQVIREDDGPSWTQSYYSMIHNNNVVLDVDQLGHIASRTVAKKLYFRPEDHKQPNPQEAASHLHAFNGTTQKVIQTEFYQKAQKVLKDSPYFNILFKYAAVGWSEGNRNNNLCKMVGSLTKPLIKKCKATIEQIYSLMLPIAESLGEGWATHCWGIINTCYTNDIAVINKELEEAAKKAQKEYDVLDKMLEGMKEWNNHPVLQAAHLAPSDEFDDTEKVSNDTNEPTESVEGIKVIDPKDEAREFVRSNALATVGNYFFPLNKEGYYEPISLNPNQVISRIRKTHLKDIIPTTKTGNNGEEQDSTLSQIQNAYSTAVSTIQMKPVGDRGGYIVDMNGTRPTLVLSTFSLNKALEPTYNEFVDSWLKALGGDSYETLCQWIGNALAFDEGLICALSLEGASNAGKKLLIVGLSECLKEPCIAGPLDIYNKSEALLKTCILAINEAWPDQRSTGISPADTFKSLLGGDGIRVEEKFKPAMTILNPIRMILTANDDGIIRTLTKGKDMTYDNRVAIGERLFHFKVGPADRFLRSIGGMAFTSQPGARWIRPDSGAYESDFVVAKHFLYLHKHRAPIDPSQRFLVMGNSAPGCGAAGQMTVFERLLADGNKTPLVAKAIIQMVDDKAVGIWGKCYRINAERTRLWVTRAGVDKYVKEILEARVDEYEVFSSMQNLLAKAEPDVGQDDKFHWYEISVESLAMIANERGIEHSVIRELVENREMGVKA